MYEDDAAPFEPPFPARPNGAPKPPARNAAPVVDTEPNPFIPPTAPAAVKAHQVHQAQQAEEQPRQARQFWEQPPAESADENPVDIANILASGFGDSVTFEEVD